MGAEVEPALTVEGHRAELREPLTSHCYSKPKMSQLLHIVALSLEFITNMWVIMSEKLRECLLSINNIKKITKLLFIWWADDMDEE